MPGMSVGCDVDIVGILYPEDHVSDIAARKVRDMPVFGKPFHDGGGCFFFHAFHNFLEIELCLFYLKATGNSEDIRYYTSISVFNIF